MIKDEKTFTRTARTFYDNSECNSIEEFYEDMSKISQIKTHFVRFDQTGTANMRLLLNHFIGFLNCFGIMSEELLKYKLDDHLKINALFVFIGNKKFDGHLKIDEEFFIELNKKLKE